VLRKRLSRWSRGESSNFDMRSGMVSYSKLRSLNIQFRQYKSSNSVKYRYDCLRVCECNSGEMPKRFSCEWGHTCKLSRGLAIACKEAIVRNKWTTLQPHMHDASQSPEVHSLSPRQHRRHVRRQSSLERLSCLPTPSNNSDPRPWCARLRQAKRLRTIGSRSLPN
jgi:hypothetical protein